MNDHTTRLKRPDNLTLEEAVQWYIDNHVVVMDYGCWEMPNVGHHADGYAVVGSKYWSRLAHRLFYEALVGEIPDGLLVCHHCDNPGCVNPRHLFLGTKADNALDKVGKGRQHRLAGADNPSARLNEDDVLEIRRLYATGEQTQQELGKLFGVSQSHISQIVQGESWAHID